MADLTNIISSGASSKSIDIVFLAEGYQASEKEKFLFDAQNFTDYMFSVSSNLNRLNDPFSKYQKFFNVNALFLASAQSGTDQPNKGIFVDTYFSSTQYGADGRLNYGNQAKVASVLSQQIPENAQEIAVVLINSSVYGGAGGPYAWATTGDIASAEVMLHEIGHSFAGLADEYVDPALVNSHPLYLLNSANVTNSTSNIPWSAWIGHTDELGTVGLYEGGYYRSSGAWRATQNSKMLSLGKPFNAPQKEAFALKFYKSIGDYLELQSNIPGLLAATTPDTELFNFSWSINNQTHAERSTYFDAYKIGAYKNGNTISVNTIDNSGYIRTGLEQTKQTEKLTLDNVAMLDVDTESYLLNQSSILVRMNSSDNQIQIATEARNNYIDGGFGVDTLLLSSTSTDFDLKKMESGTFLFMQQGHAVMAAINIEKVQFSDKIVWLGDATTGTVQGTSGNDTLRVTLNNNNIDGLGGLDTVILLGQRAEFTITSLETGEWTVSSAQWSGTLRNIERLKFDDSAVALDIQGHGGQAYRLYQAAFDRAPDKAGLGYWINYLDNDGKFIDVAAGFVDSVEFKKLYGINPSPERLITRFYQNVLHREPEIEGMEYWLNQLTTGAQTAPTVLANFSESGENQANLLGVLSDGFSYTPWI